MVCLTSEAPDHPDLRVTYFQGATPPKLRYLDCFYGLSHKVNFGVYQRNLPTLVRALKERAFFIKKNGTFVPPPEPSPGQFTGLELFRCHLKRLSPYTIPLKPQQFVDLFQDRRRAVYQKAVDDNLRYGFSNVLALIGAFLKYEKYNYTAKWDPTPRVIQPRDPRYIVETGRYIKPIEKISYKNINKVFGHIAVFKGLNAEERGARLREHWDSFQDPVAVSMDASRFDQHVSRQALEWEHSIYEAFYPGDKYFANLMKLQRNNKGRARSKEGTLRYHINRNRMSGDSNTSLGNVTIMTGLVWTYAQERKIRVKVANDGDDTVVIMEAEDLAAFQAGFEEWFLAYGFTMTVEIPVSIFERISFCQCQPVFDGYGWIMVRDPRVALAKDCLSLKPLNGEKIMRRWMSAVGKGGLSLAGGIPLWQNFYRQFVQKSNGAKPLVDPSLRGGVYFLSKGQKRDFRPIDPQCRYSFWLAFGISPEEQLATEKIFDEYVLDPCQDPHNVAGRFRELPFRA